MDNVESVPLVNPAADNILDKPRIIGHQHRSLRVSSQVHERRVMWIEPTSDVGKHSRLQEAGLRRISENGVELRNQTVSEHAVALHDAKLVLVLTEDNCRQKPSVLRKNTPDHLR